MKTISLELSKKLAPYLEWVETEYIWVHIQWCDSIIKSDNWLDEYKYICKTLTLEEAIEFLWNINIRWEQLWIYKKSNWNWIIYYWFGNVYEWETLLEAVEKMLEYLLTENLLWEQK